MNDHIKGFSTAYKAYINNKQSRVNYCTDQESNKETNRSSFLYIKRTDFFYRRRRRRKRKKKNIDKKRIKFDSLVESLPFFSNEKDCSIRYGKIVKIQGALGVATRNVFMVKT